MTIHFGDLTVTTDSTLANLTKIVGNLCVCRGITLDAPELDTITKSLGLETGATLNVPKLEKIEKGLYSVDGDITINAPNLVIVGDFLCVSNGAILNVPSLTTVCGYLHLGGNLTLYESPTINVPKLTTIGEGLILDHGVTLNAPSLTMVEGDLYLHPSAILNVPITSAYGQPGRELTRCPDRGYVLWLGDNGLYYAGCRRDFTRKQALEHWSSDKSRAKLFRAAISATNGSEPISLMSIILNLRVFK